jgi:hypothetical protein
MFTLEHIIPSWDSSKRWHCSLWVVKSCCNIAVEIFLGGDYKVKYFYYLHSSFHKNIMLLLFQAYIIFVMVFTVPPTN